MVSLAWNWMQHSLAGYRYFLRINKPERFLNANENLHNSNQYHLHKIRAKIFGKKKIIYIKKKRMVTGLYISYQIVNFEWVKSKYKLSRENNL